MGALRARANSFLSSEVSMWKYPPTADVGNVLAHITRLSLYVRNGVAAYNNTIAHTGNNQDVLYQSAEPTRERLSPN